MSSSSSPRSVGWFARLAPVVLLTLTAGCGSPATIGGLPPVIASFAPASGPVGTDVVLKGASFDATADHDVVKFNGVPATVAAASATSLTVRVPSGAITGAISVTVGEYTAVTAGPFTVTTAGGEQAPTITTQPADATVAPGDSAGFSVVASGTAPLSYQWKLGGQAISGATAASYTITGVTTGHAGSYTVTVSNTVGSVDSTAAVLTVSSSTGSLTAFNLTGFGAATTGGGVIAETDAAYRKVTTPLELATAIRDSNKTQGLVKVIEIMNDLDLGWTEVGSSVQGLSSTPFRAHNAPKLHPALLSKGVSVIDLKTKGGGLTMFSANGATLRHATLNVKGTSNIIIRNLKFDELWEWDESTKGNYDSNDWDFIDLGNGGTVTDIWIDHCTFTKTYDGIVDIKGGSSGITFSWNRYVGDDGATNSASFVRQQLNALEASKSSYPMYNFFRSNGFSLEDIAAIHRGHDKTHLIGGTALDSANAAFSVTFHHQWYKNTWDRLPRLRAGQVHTYDILADDTEELVALRKAKSLVAAMSSSNQSTANNTYNMSPPLNGSISTEGGAVLVESSVYIDCLWPLRNNQTDPTDPTYTGKILAKDTMYTMHNTDGTTTTVRGTSTDAANPLGPVQATVIPFSWNTFSALPYTYTLDDPGQLPSLLQASAGAGALSWAKSQWLKTSY